MDMKPDAGDFAASPPAATLHTAPLHTAALHLTLLGEVGVSWQGKPLPVSAPRLLGLLAYLHLHGPALRSELLDLLWPGQGTQAVRQALYTLRRLPGAEHWLEDGPGPQVRLHAVSDLARLRAGLSRAAPKALAELVEAGPLLHTLNLQVTPGFDEWLQEERGALTGELREALRRRAHQLYEAHDDSGARECLKLRLRLDPLDESAYRDLMKLEHRSGPPGEALEVFERLRQTLRSEVGSEPEARTLELLQELENHQVSGQNRARLLTPTQQEAVPAETLFGRDDEQAALAEMLRRRGRALVQGMPGMGKTRLAWAEAGRRLQAGERVLWLEVGSDLLEVLRPALAEALELRSEGSRPYAAAVQAALRQRQVGLIVLDNAAGSYALSLLLQDLPADLPVLVTSRLRLPRLPLLPLHRLPRPGALALMMAHLGHTAPGQGAGPDSPELDIPGLDITELDKLCSVLGDHPYALRLAAITLQKGGQSARELREALAEAPHTLGEGYSVQALLQQSLHALDAASYEAYLGLGSLFTPQTTPELLALALRRSPEETEQALYTLTAHGLTTREAREGHDQISYRMHELTWQDARAHAALQPKAVASAVSDYALSHSASPDALYAELPNLIGAAKHATRHQPDLLVKLMAGWLGKNYLQTRGFPLGHLELLNAAIRRAEDQHDWPMAHLLAGKRGNIYNGLLNDAAAAIRDYLLAAHYARAAGLLTEEALCTSVAGGLQALHHLPEAQATQERAQQLATQSRDIICLSQVLQQQSIGRAMLKEYQAAYDGLTEVRAMLSGHLAQNHPRAHELRHQYRMATSNLGHACLRLGRLQEALALKKEALQLAQSSGEQLWIAASYAELGELLMHLGESAESRAALERAIELYQEVGATGQEEATRALLRLPP